MRSGASLLRQGFVSGGRVRRWKILIAIVGALSIVCLPVSAEHALAKRVTSRLQAVINGKRYKSSKRGVSGLYATTSFSVNGASKQRHGVVRSITVNCGPVDIKTVGLPITLTCSGFYTQSGARSSDFRQWLGDAMELGVESLVGNRITGTFRGEMAPAPANLGESPVSIGNGVFSLMLTGVGV